MEDPIKEFFADQEVFITGATGFMGKAFVEKLLRSCPQVKRIFILIREKRGKTCEDRLNDMKKSKIFDKVHNISENLFDKVIPINGDIKMLNLGMSSESRKLLENVSIIFHAAATVRFDESLKSAILLNVRGTREMLNFAKELKNLKIFLHVSTAYSNTYETYIKEMVYEPKMCWKKVINMAERFDTNQLNGLSDKFIDGFPNTYTITKHLGEKAVDDYRHLIPVAILRPTIVCASESEPYPGWCDNFYAAMGLVVGINTGVVRSLYCKPDAVIDLTPLDLSIKLAIVAAWQSAENPSTKSNMTEVYHTATTNLRSYSIRTMQKVNSDCVDQISFNKFLWYPNFSITNNVYKYYFDIYLFHVLPAILLDGLIMLFRRKPIMLKIQRRSIYSMRTLRFFMFNEYQFETKKFYSIMSDMKIQSEDFRCDSLFTVTGHEFARKAILGARRYLLHEDDKTIPQANKRLKVIKYIDMFVKQAFVGWITYIIINKIYLIYL